LITRYAGGMNGFTNDLFALYGPAAIPTTESKKLDRWHTFLQNYVAIVNLTFTFDDDRVLIQKDQLHAEV
jgi:hypothetical protein